MAEPSRNGRIAEEAELRSARERFAALSRREAAPACLSMLFVLKRLQAADLVVVDEGENRPPAYLADLGAGNLALVRLRETSAPPTTLIGRSEFWRPPYIVDAGDVVFAVVPRSSALLESSTLTARRNRRAKERQASVEDDDD